MATGAGGLRLAASGSLQCSQSAHTCQALATLGFAALSAKSARSPTKKILLSGLGSAKHAARPHHLERASHRQTSLRGLFWSCRTVGVPWLRLRLLSSTPWSSAMEAASSASTRYSSARPRRQPKCRHCRARSSEGFESMWPAAQCIQSWGWSRLRPCEDLRDGSGHCLRGRHNFARPRGALSGCGGRISAFCPGIADRFTMVRFARCDFTNAAGVAASEKSKLNRTNCPLGLVIILGSS